MNKHLLLTLIFLISVAMQATAQSFTPDECRGSRMPYPAPDSIAAAPDSLMPVMIYHVGRHGARYPTSTNRFLAVEANLQSRADALTPDGRKLLDITTRAIETINDRWGALDSLGIAEQRGIADRLCNAFPQLVVGQNVTAISSYVERCVRSMEAFTGEIKRMQAGTGSISESSGKEYSPLMRPFAVDSAYVRWAKEKPYAADLNKFTAETTPATAVIGRMFKPEAAGEFTQADATDLCASIYYVVASLAAMSSPDADTAMALLTPDEQNALWEIDNLHQYYSRTQTVISTLPADIASPLLRNMIASVDDFIAGTDRTALQLHFGHAETLMPLLSLMRLPGCYYLTHYPDTVKKHWQTFHVVPMASNLQVILLRSRSGRHYVRIDLNERPLQVNGSVYQPWASYRQYLMRLLTF